MCRWDEFRTWMGNGPVRYRWTLHNLVGHPLSEVLYQMGWHRASAVVHDETMPLGSDEEDHG